MAFNFNWSPLMADSLFYNRTQDLLTAALNKSPKPPIIIDDIDVTELNLGSIPPELEILEIGDLAEDRFRGIFKMSYRGDAYLTLKTVVQANPLNTYLLTRNEFTSMKPLAADAGLTIPLQLTLSEFHLSGFVILVFSKQKGLTVVFRNDPLESLKVSSTFDSIPFVRDYLQKAIEGQLRQLFMDELPAIIHRLSLRLWVPEYKTLMDRETQDQTRGASISPSLAPDHSLPPQDPFLNPPSDPVDSAGHVLTTSEIGALSLDSSVEMHSLFSQKNLLRLAALADSQRTLSLFTPSISEVAFRACANANPDMAGGATPAILIPRSGSSLGLYGSSGPGLSRSVSRTRVPASDASKELQVPSETTSTASGSYTSKPGIGSWSNYGLSLGAGRQQVAYGKRGANKKKKRRVVDLRKKPLIEAADECGEQEQEQAGLEHQNNEMKDTIEDRESSIPIPTPEMERIPNQGAYTQKVSEDTPDEGCDPATSHLYGSSVTCGDNSHYRPDRSMHLQPPQLPLPPQSISSASSIFEPDQHLPYSIGPNPPHSPCQAQHSHPHSIAGGNAPDGDIAVNAGPGLFEQAVMMQMAGDLARRVQQFKERRARAERPDGPSDEDEGIPPPPPYRQ